MLAFRGVSSSKDAEWSEALTTCRRLLEGLADQLRPVFKETVKGRILGQAQYAVCGHLWTTPLVIADLLDYLGSGQKSKAEPDIQSATIDELEALLDISRATAKEIIKARVQYGKLDKSLLSKVRGVGPKIVEKVVTAFAL